ncbi:MAG TPA: PTS sugar transporter subunit IIA, partial [Spirochaetota bacterium]|nr:PTS sugar transporter subunit IIA [Spirochaetota bacterium]
AVPSVIDYTNSKYIKKLQAVDKYEAIEELAMVFKDSDFCDDIETLISALKEREQIMSTGIGFGIAIPHAKINTVKEIAFAIGISEKGIDFDAMDGQPVKLIILVIAGEKQHKDYLKLLSNIMGILKKEPVKESIINASSPEEIIEIFKKNSSI